MEIIVKPFLLYCNYFITNLLILAADECIAVVAVTKLLRSDYAAMDLSTVVMYRHDIVGLLKFHGKKELSKIHLMINH